MHQTSQSAITSFFSVIPSSTDEADVTFEEFHRDSNWFPKVFDLEGEPVRLLGPLEVISKFRVNGVYQEIRTKKRRFVRVEFYSFTNQGLKLTRKAYAWQGENNLLHLLEDLIDLNDDPLGVNVQTDEDSSLTEEEFYESLDSAHEDVLSTMFDSVEAFEAKA